MENAWAVHQVETTVDFARESRVLSWLLGGLNFQIEHHLFPRICHVHYPAIAGMVEETCREFGVRYTEHRSFRAGIASHFRWLRRMGMPDPIGQPGADGHRSRPALEDRPSPDRSRSVGGAGGPRPEQGAESRQYPGAERRPFALAGAHLRVTAVPARSRLAPRGRRGPNPGGGDEVSDAR